MSLLDGNEADEGQPFLHINLGHVLCIASVLISASVAYAGITSGLAVHTVQIARIERNVDEMHTDLSTVQKDVNLMKGRLFPLPHGELDHPPGSDPG